jgi:hypothetical protein
VKNRRQKQRPLKPPLPHIKKCPALFKLHKLIPNAKIPSGPIVIVEVDELILVLQKN